MLTLTSYGNEKQKSEDLVWSSTVSINGESNIYSIPRDEIKEETIDTTGRRLHFVEVYKEREKGPKPLIVFVHGTPGAWWDQIAFLANEFLRDNFHMIAVDRLGHGESIGNIEPSLQAQAASIKSLLDRDTTGKGAILVGHSLGGPIIARTAMDYPGRVNGLVFIASTGDPKRSRRWYNTIGGIPPIRWMLSKKLLRSNKEILPLKRQLKMMLPLWQTITAPTTIIQGGKDELVNPKNADFIKQALVNSKVKMILKPKANHSLHWEQPYLVIDALAEFISSSSRN